MPIGIMVLLFGVVGYVIDWLEKENKRKNRQQKSLHNQSKSTNLVNPLTKKPLNTAFWGAFNSVFDTSTQKLDSTGTSLDVKQKLDQELLDFEDDYEDEEFYEDEENFETELTTPMSMAIDEEPLYSESEWETIAQEKSDVKIVDLTKTKQVKKRGLLQKAYIYSEVFGKPKGLE